MFFQSQAFVHDHRDGEQVIFCTVIFHPIWPDQNATCFKGLLYHALLHGFTSLSNPNQAEDLRRSSNTATPGVVFSVGPPFIIESVVGSLEWLVPRCIHRLQSSGKPTRRNYHIRVGSSRHFLLYTLHYVALVGVPYQTLLLETELAPYLSHSVLCCILIHPRGVARNFERGFPV